jgi:hypothetical protein
MTTDRSEVIPRIIEKLYAGTLNDAAWRRALLSLADLFGASEAHEPLRLPPSPSPKRVTTTLLLFRLSLGHRNQGSARPTAYRGYLRDPNRLGRESNEKKTR